MRIGTTSFIYPGSWAQNVRRLGPDFEDIELLFFEAGEGSLPGTSELAELRALKREHGLSYSLHTPLDASLASEDAARRAAGVAAVLRAIDAARSLEPENLVVHVYHGDGEGDPQRPRDLDAWRARARDSLAALLAHGVAPERLNVELLDYDFALIEPVVRQLGLSVALDVGHLVRDGLDELAVLAHLLPLTRIVQWHGTDPSGRDHRSLEHYPPARARALLDTLEAAGYAGVLTLEVFRESDLHASRALLEQLLAERGASWPREGA